MADKKEKDLEPEKEIVREVHVQAQECNVCGFLAEDILPIKLRRVIPIDGVIDPDYEHDYGVPVCGKCRLFISEAIAEAEVAAIRAIQDECRPILEAKREEVALFMAFRDAREARVLQKYQNEEDPENVG